jgi:hypothetical protein
MFHFILIILYLSVELKATEVFSFAEEFPQVIINEEEISNAFTGGLNKPKIQWFDHDGDGDIDLFLLDMDGHLRYYENRGNSTDHDFFLKSSHFQNVLPAGWFSFRDLDLDGDLDLATQNISALWGGYSGIRLYTNTNGDYQVLTDTLFTDSGGPMLTEIQSTPTFADIDNDGDEDFFTGGSSSGTVTYFKNLEVVNDIPVFSHITDFWQGLSIIGLRDNPDSSRHGASAITFIDLDGDSDLDLSWGDFFQQSLYIIWNIGSPEVPEMDIENIVTQYPPMNPIQTSGQNMPTFADLDGDGDQDLFVAVLSGAYGVQYIDNFYQYLNIGSANNPIYEFETDDFFQSLDLYTGTVTELADIDGDGDPELLIGTEIDYSVSPFRGKIKFFENTGSTEGHVWQLLDEDFLGTNLGYNLAPCAGDLDNDGDQDILVGDYNGKIFYYERIGEVPNESSYEFIEELNDIDLSGRSHPELADIDGDGDLDLFIGENWGVIHYYENIGTTENHNFILVSEYYADIDVGEYSTPEFSDIDFDGDLDLFVGSQEGTVYFFRNSGTVTDPVFQQDSTLTIPYIGGSANVSAYYNSNSGGINLIAGIYSGGLYYLEMELPNIPEITVPYISGWNLVGISMYVDSSYYSDVFPDAVPGTLYGFDDTYVSISELVLGEGYWLFFDESGSQTISGETVETLTLSLTSGWNLISGISITLDISNAIDPENIIIPGTLYSFSNSYVQTSEISPGIGYWLNANSNGEITLSSSSPLTKSRHFHPPKNLNTLTLEHMDLFFGNSIKVENPLSFTLPPKPPAPSTDIRFSGDTKLCTTDECVIEVMNDGRPLTFDCNIKDGESWEIVDEGGEVFECSSVNVIELSGESETFILRKPISHQTPTKVALFPAHPNPFNPVTTISFSIPNVEMLHATSLRIYDLTGKLVETLVDEKLSPGNHSVQWDGSGVSSGVYFVKLVFREYRGVQKIILLQ